MTGAYHPDDFKTNDISSQNPCSYSQNRLRRLRNTTCLFGQNPVAAGLAIQQLSLAENLIGYKTLVQTTPAKLLDVVALLEDKPASRLSCGQVGTIVEVLAPDVFEVEFCDSEGRTIGFAELRRTEFLVLRHEPALAA